MRAEVVSPERVLYEGDTDMVVCRTPHGEIAFLENHEPFLGMLAPGEIRVVNAKEEYVFEATRGFIEVDGQHVRIISDDAMNK